ncbi:MAG: PQQ-dependent sugar dehydrogenase, partial [Anaerolineaceae bacterium]
MKKTIILLSILLLGTLAACGREVSPGEPDSMLPVIPVATVTRPSNEPALTNTPEETTILAEPTVVPEPISIAAQNLETPWEIAFLPDGKLLVTERPGTLVVIGGAEYVRIPITDVYERSESGLLGLALHPDFEQNQWLYLYLTYETPDGLLNRVERHRFDDGKLSESTVIFDQIPGSNNHDGGRIEFGPDGLLYITTGDSQNS